MRILMAMLLVGAGPRDPVTHRLTGLFSKEREEDLRKIFAERTDIRLVSVDYEAAEASFEYDEAKAFPGAKPAQVIERFDSLLRNASRGTFGIKPRSTVSADKLTRIEIPVAGLDCKGCDWAAYGAVAKIDGVERATVSFKEGRLTAWIDPDKTNRAALEEALKKKEVKIKSP